MADRPELPRLCLVTDRRRTRGRDLVELCAQAARGGVGLIQIREKDLAPDELRELVRRVRDAVPPGTLLAVNGNAVVARTAGVGLHLPAAAPAPRTRRGLPLLGRSVHDAAEARRARAEGADYVLLGTIHPTESKPGRPGAGVAVIAELRPLLDPVPIYAVGGITVSNAPEAIHAGAWGVAVCGAILASNRPRRVAEALALALAVATGDEPGA